MPGEALLLTMTDVDPAVDDQFNDWLNTEHVPQVLAVSGVLSGRRFHAIEGQPKYLAVYDVEDVGVLEGAEYQNLRAVNPTASEFSRRIRPYFRQTTRGVYRRILTYPEPESSDLSPARALLLVGLDVQPNREDAFHDWYNTEHIPCLSQVRGVIRARRFKLHAEASGLEGSPVGYVALYDLERPEVLSSDQWKRAADTPWSRRIRRFHTRRVYNVYERIYPAWR